MGHPLAGIEHAQQVFKAAAGDGKARVVVLFDQCQVLFKAGRDVQAHHIGARHHQRGDLAVVQAEQVAHHGVFVLFDGTRRGAFGQHGMDFILGHRGFIAGARPAEQTQGGAGQHPHKRLGQLGQQVDGAGHQTGNGLGVGLAQALGYQFAHDDGHIGDQDHHHGRGDRAGVGNGHAHCSSQSDSGWASAASPKIPLSTPMEVMPIWMVERKRVVFPQLHRCGCSAVALINQLLQSCFAGRDQCDLGHGNTPLSG
jgi:hypothetical protein